MKKLILGCTIAICGTMWLCVEHIKEIIMYTFPQRLIMPSNYQYGLILIGIGIVLCLLSLYKKDNKDK